MAASHFGNQIEQLAIIFPTPDLRRHENWPSIIWENLAVCILHQYFCITFPKLTHTTHNTHNHTYTFFSDTTSKPNFLHSTMPHIHNLYFKAWYHSTVIWSLCFSLTWQISTDWSSDPLCSQITSCLACENHTFIKYCNYDNWLTLPRSSNTK